MLFVFGDYALDTDRRELRAGSNNIAVEPQVFDLLEFLIRHRDRVVSRDELIEHVWSGRIVSESALATRINAARRVIGDDGSRQALIKTVMRKGVRFIGTVRDQPQSEDSLVRGTPSPHQVVTFCKASDGVNLAVATSGNGPVLVKTSSWLNHLEFDWASPIFSPLFSRLAARFRLVRYDGRGSGLSDRDVDDISFAGFVRDLEAAVAAQPAERFALFGMSQGVATAIAYAVKHPERVSHLIVLGGYAQGRNRRGDADRGKGAMLRELMREGWGEEISAFMRAFSSIYIPNGTTEQVKWFSDMQRMATSADLAVRLRDACDEIDIVSLLCRVSVPTLVLHARRDNVAPYVQGRLLASSIPNARLVSLDSDNHIPLKGEPAWDAVVAEITSFTAA